MTMANKSSWQPAGGTSFARDGHSSEGGSAQVLSSHWRAATHPLSMFWPHPGRWHEAAPRAKGAAGLIAWFTTSPGAVGS